MGVMGKQAVITHISSHKRFVKNMFYLLLLCVYEDVLGTQRTALLNLFSTFTWDSKFQICWETVLPDVPSHGPSVQRKNLYQIQ